MGNSIKSISFPSPITVFGGVLCPLFYGLLWKQRVGLFSLWQFLDMAMMIAEPNAAAAALTVEKLLIYGADLIKRETVTFVFCTDTNTAHA